MGRAADGTARAVGRQRERKRLLLQGSVFGRGLAPPPPFTEGTLSALAWSLIPRLFFLLPRCCALSYGGGRRSGGGG